MPNQTEQERLLEEINSALETSPPSPLTPVVRKVARLARLCGEMEYYWLFQHHLDGYEPGDDRPRVEEWPQGQRAKWDAREALISDRAIGNNKVQGISLELLEQSRDDMYQRIQKLEQSNRPVSEKLANS